jgi:hypothetical protein
MITRDETLMWKAYKESYTHTTAKEDYVKIVTLLDELNEYFSTDNVSKFLNRSKTPDDLKPLHSEDEKIAIYIKTAEPMAYKLLEVNELISKYKNL